jgi:hypothetical protein
VPSHLRFPGLALDALHKKYGRDGLKDQPLADVAMLLASKELNFRDAPKGQAASEEQRAANRALELEIRDLAGSVNSQLAAANVLASRYPRLFGQSQQQDQHKQKQKTRDHEHER